MDYSIPVRSGISAFRRIVVRLEEQKAELRNLEYMHVLNDDGSVSYGCDQDWYALPWQRMAGCGPTVATNIIFYMSLMHGFRLPVEARDKTGCVKLMELTWRHVTPGHMGVNKPEMLSDGVLAFAGEHGLTLASFMLRVSKKASDRPALREVTAFLSEALRQDSPVAFLNLCNGKVEELDEWHWVTLVALKVEPDGTAAATIYDGDQSFDMDIGLWLTTTKRGGGFVYFKHDPPDIRGLA
jgi:hypothetical protein